MKFSLDSGGGIVIRAWSANHVTVAYPPSRAGANIVELATTPDARPRLIEEQLSASFIVAAEHLVRDWGPRSFAELTREHLQRLAEFDAEVVLLGTGPTLRFPDASWLAEFHRRGIGIEVMDTGAACRTYNVLMAEGRRVVAGLLVTATC